MTYLTAPAFNSARQIDHTPVDHTPVDRTPMKITTWKKVGGTTIILCPAWKLGYWKQQLVAMSEHIDHYVIEEM